MSTVSGRPMDSVFEEQVASALQKRGYQVHPQVGIAGFFIDLAIADPDLPAVIFSGLNVMAALIILVLPESVIAYVKPFWKIMDGSSTESEY